MSCRRECLDSSEGVALLDGLSGKATLSRKSANKDLKEMQTPGRALEGGHSGEDKSQGERLGACLTHLGTSQDDSK